MHVNRIILFFGLLLGLASCGLLDNEGQKRVRSILKDPSSAQFRNLVEFQGADGHLYCGEVNGKNSYGALTGFSRFVVKDRVIFMGDEGYIYHDEGRKNEIPSIRNMDDFNAEMDIKIVMLAVENRNLKFKVEHEPPVATAIDTAWEMYCK